jgi:hypothetical protein
MMDKLNNVNAFQTVQNMDFDEIDYHMRHGDRNTYAKALIELKEAMDMGNEAIVKDFERINDIDHGTGELFKRIADLTILGLEVDPDQYENIYNLNEDGFKAAIQLVQMKVPIKDFSIFEDCVNNPSLAGNMLKFAASKVTDHNTGETSRVADWLVADEMKNLLTGNHDLPDLVTQEDLLTSKMMDDAKASNVYKNGVSVQNTILSRKV